jgi:type II secretory pathway pseudopilin PulG
MLRRRLQALTQDERGFTIIETVIAITLIFASLTALAFVAINGFRFIALSRTRIKATGIANEIMEGVRAIPYQKVTKGISASEISSDPDPRILNCGTEYYLDDCPPTGAERVVSSTFAGGYTAQWIVPHTGTMTDGGITFGWSTYVTVNDTESSPYKVTVRVGWTGGSVSGNPNNFVQVQSLTWSPSGCVSSATHPFGAPCQSFFYGLAEVPASAITIEGQFHNSTVDFQSGSLNLAGATATIQQEQSIDLDAKSTEPGISITDSTGDASMAGLEAVTEADTDPVTATTELGGATLTALGGFLERLQPDCCGLIGPQFTVPAGTSGGVSATVAALSTDTYKCPVSGAWEIDALPCSGASTQQAGTLTVVTPFDHQVSGLGLATLVRVTAPSASSTASVDRDPVSGKSGILDVRVSRTLGNIYLGGLPTSGLIAPVGMSTSSSNDANYCVRIVGYQDSAQAVSGQQTTTNPSATITVPPPGMFGTIYLYNANTPGFSSYAVTDSAIDTVDLDALTSSVVRCETTGIVGTQTVTWRVSVDIGGITHATTSISQTTDPIEGVNTKLEVEARATPVQVTLRYELIANGVHEVDVTINTNLGELLARSMYGPPPPAQGG